jgi:nucleoside-diphosphate-sugar epimerase
MVIGRGLIARTFEKYENNDEFLIFASGVSHSKSCTPDDFKRERGLLLSGLRGLGSKKVVYFSTTSLYDPDMRDTPYIRHKLNMEDLLRQHASAWHVFRLSNLAGASPNPSTVLNFFNSSIRLGHPFELWNHSERNIIDVADVFRIADHILGNGLFLNRIVNVANEKNYSVQYIVQCIESFSHKKAIFTEREKGATFGIDISDILPVCRALQIGFGPDYLPLLLEKYYSAP